MQTDSIVLCDWWMNQLENVTGVMNGYAALKVVLCWPHLFLQVQGKLRIGFKWLPHAPYVKMVSIGFVSIPIHHVTIKLFSVGGASLTDMPFINSWCASHTLPAPVPCSQHTSHNFFPFLFDPYCARAPWALTAAATWAVSLPFGVDQRYPLNCSLRAETVLRETLLGKWMMPLYCGQRNST